LNVRNPSEEDEYMTGSKQCTFQEVMAGRRVRVEGAIMMMANALVALDDGECAYTHPSIAELVVYRDYMHIAKMLVR
jgi:hypothetical protein